ncbi:MAG: hypothetical protein ACFE95_20220 [Candidatus Hodarchaeota archaeon]
MKKKELLSILNKHRRFWEIKLKQYSSPDHAEFYGILARVSLLDYVISLTNQLECCHSSYSNNKNLKTIETDNSNHRYEETEVSH